MNFPFFISLCTTYHQSIKILHTLLLCHLQIHHYDHYIMFHLSRLKLLINAFYLLSIINHISAILPGVYSILMLIVIFKLAIIILSDLFGNENQPFPCFFLSIVGFNFLYTIQISFFVFCDVLPSL